MDKSGNYTTYLLRVQQPTVDANPNAPIVRLILEDTRTGKRQVFEGVVELVTFLFESAVKPNTH